MRNGQTKVDRPQRNIYRGRPPQDHISAGRRPTGFDEADLPLRRAHSNRHVQLRMAAPLTPFPSITGRMVLRSRREVPASGPPGSR